MRGQSRHRTRPGYMPQPHSRRRCCACAQGRSRLPLLFSCGYTSDRSEATDSALTSARPRRKWQWLGQSDASDMPDHLPPVRAQLGASPARPGRSAAGTSLAACLIFLPLPTGIAPQTFKKDGNICQGRARTAGEEGQPCSAREVVGCEAGRPLSFAARVDGGASHRASLLSTGRSRPAPSIPVRLWDEEPACPHKCVPAGPCCRHPRCRPSRRPDRRRCSTCAPTPFVCMPATVSGRPACGTLPLPEPRVLTQRRHPAPPASLLCASVPSHSLHVWPPLSLQVPLGSLVADPLGAITYM